MKVAGFAVVVAVCIASALSPREASACAPPFCSAGAAAPDPGASIPRNTPALVLVQPADSGGTPLPTQIELRKADGTQVPFTAEEYDLRTLLLRPDGLLEAGESYLLSYEEGCPQFAGPTNDAGFVEVPFTAGGLSLLPISAGSVSATVAVEPALKVPTLSGSCSAEIRAAVARLVIQPSASLEPFLPVTRFRVYWDGKLWAVSAWGGLSDAGVMPPVKQFGIPSRDPSAVHARCPPAGNDGHDPGASIGFHTIEVIAEIAGRADLPPMTVQVDLQCNAAPQDAGVKTDAGTGGADAGVDNGADAGTSYDQGEPVAEGCSCSTSGAVAAWALLALIGSIAFRRRGA